MSSPATDFKLAVQARDIDGAFALLADDVVFHSPAVHRPYQGKETVSGLLRLVVETFEDFRYTDVLAGPDADALIFEARVGDRELQGIDLLRTDHGKITDFTVMIRPASGLIALAERLGPKLEAAGIVPAT